MSIFDEIENRRRTCSQNNVSPTEVWLGEKEKQRFIDECFKNQIFLSYSQLEKMEWRGLKVKFMSGQGVRVGVSFG